MNPYLGHENQMAYVEEHRLVGGKGDGMRLLELSNGIGLQLTVSADRCCDISRLSFRGINMSYFAPCGYVAPGYYDCVGDGFLKSFTAGFLTTCGLHTVGSPGTDEGEELPLHGRVANLPAEWVRWERDENVLRLEAEVSDAALFARKLTLRRRLEVSLHRNEFTLTDTVRNDGDRREPIEILYHMNMGYPLLDEDSVLEIPSQRVSPRNRHAEEDIAHWMRIEKPQPGYEERCYFHEFSGEGLAGIFQPKLGVGLKIHFDPRELGCFTEWKMMGVRDYVLGLEPGNCLPIGRAEMRKQGLLKFLQPGESSAYRLRVEMTSELK